MIVLSLGSESWPWIWDKGYWFWDQKPWYWD